MNKLDEVFRKKIRFFLCILYKAFFFVIAWLPHQLYCIGAFFLTLPEEWKMSRTYSTAPKEVVFCRLSDTRMNIHEAVELIYEKRKFDDDQRDHQDGWPAWIRRVQDLIREYQDTFWRFGSVEEFEGIPDKKLIEDIIHSPLALLPKNTVFIWAIHQRSATFVGYNPFTGELHQGMLGYAPFSPSPENQFQPVGEHFVYAVSVRIKEKEDVS